MGNVLEDPRHTTRTEGSKEWYSGLPIAAGDPDFCTYFNDFFVYTAGDWTVTTVEAGAGSATEALTADDRNGSLLLTNDDADNDSDSLQLKADIFGLAKGKRLWYETKIKVSDASQVDMFIGLNITDTTPLATTDRVGFQITDESTAIEFLTEKNSTETKEPTEVNAADDTYVTLGFSWDGSNKLDYFVNREKKGSITTNVPDDEDLAITMHIQNGEAVAKTMSIDYIFCAQER